MSTAYCPWCRRSGIALTKRGLLWRHQPHSRKYSGGYVTACEGSGRKAKDFYTRPAKEGQTS